MSDAQTRQAGDGAIWSTGSGSVWPNSFAFAALTAEGGVVTWGVEGSGGAPGVYSVSQFTGTTLLADVSDQLQDGIVALFPTRAAFAALTAEGGLVTWGNAAVGGDSSTVAAALESGVRSVHATQDAFAAIREDGSVVTWGHQGRGGNSDAVAEALSGGVVAIHSNEAAFAAIRADGSVVTWGNGPWGGDSAAVAEALGDVVTIHGSERAFAALTAEGAVVTWGLADYGGDSSALAGDLSGGIVALHATGRAFAALSEDGAVHAWGSALHGGDTAAVADEIAGDVVALHTSLYAFAALRSDGSVVTWGWNQGGGDSTAVAEALSGGVVSLASTTQAFAALKEDGSVVVWGGGQATNTGAAAAALQEDVVALHANRNAFAALKADGSVVTWGNLAGGGDSAAVAEALSEGVVEIYATPTAFAALKADGSVVTWGEAARGGDSGAVADQLAGGVVALAAPRAVEPLDPADFVTPPAAPVIAPVADDDIIDPTEAAAGVTVTGSADPGATVTVTLGATARTVTADAEGAWAASFAPEDLPEPGDHLVTAQAAIAGIAGPTAERPVAILVAPEAPGIDPVAGDDVIGAAEIAEGLAVTGTAPPGATVTVSLGAAQRSVTADAEGAWQASFAAAEIPAAGAQTVVAQTLWQGQPSAPTERSVTVANSPAEIQGQTTGTVIEDDPEAGTTGGSLQVIDRDAGEDRFLPPEPAALETPYGAFAFDPDNGDWQFLLDNDSPAVRALEEGAEATATLVVTSLDGSASETISVAVQGSGVPPDAADGRALSGSVLGRDGAGLEGVTVTFLPEPEPGPAVAALSDAAGQFALAGAAVQAGHLDAERPLAPADPAPTTASALEALRLAVGLDPSWGAAGPLDFIAADIRGDGQVSTLDSLDLLRLAVGVEAASAPHWVFLDPQADLSAIDRTDTTVPTGLAVPAGPEAQADLTLLGVLVGHMAEYP